MTGKQITNQATAEDAKKFLSILFLAFPLSGDGDERSARFDAYWLVLSRLDPCFVVGACECAARGKLGNPAFLPSAGEIYRKAEELSVRACAARSHRHTRLPEPEGPPITPDRKRAILQRLWPDILRMTVAGTSRAAPSRQGGPLVLSDEAKAIFTPATNPPETLTDVEECLR